MKSKILKKLCSGLLALSMLTSPGIGQSVGELVGTSITVNAVDVLTYGDYNYTVNSDNTVTITKYIGTNITAIIPNSIDSKTVTAVGYKSFADNTNLKSITIPNSVITIGESAFDGCKNLTSINIPNMVTSIEDCTFRNCDKLTSITIPNGVTSIGWAAFVNCKCLTSITIPGSVTSIKDWAFEYCDGLKSVTIQNGVTSIGGGIFDGCTNLTAVVIPESVKSIGIAAFRCCTNLESINVNINNTVYSSKDGVLYDKSQTKLVICPGSKTSLVIPDGVTSIERESFAGCENLVSVKIPNSVVNILKSAFYGCINLTSITIPQSVESIADYYTFNGCTKLLSINVDANNTVYSSVDGMLYDKNRKKLISCPCGKKVVAIPDGTESIETAAFYECTNLISVSMTNSVKSIGNAVFYKCSSLESVTLSENLTGIPLNSFKYCTKLASITIPAKVKYIDYWAFADCSELTSITIPDSTVYLGYGTFTGCSKLANITIPSSVTEIGNGAFNGCDNLTIYGETGSYAETYAKNNNIPFKDIISDFEYTISSDDTIRITKYKGTDSYAVIPETIDAKTVKSIDSSAFADCTGLTTIYIPDSVTFIYGEKLISCPKLIDVNVSQNNKYYSSDNGVLFNKNKTSLLCYPKGKKGDYTIPDGVYSIISSTFSGCTGLTGITIPDSIQAIGKEAFKDCTELKSIIIPNSVILIEKDSFQNCAKLSSITIPNSINKIFDNTFKGCPILQIKGELGSSAEKFAKNNNIPFAALEALTRTVSFDTKGGNTLNIIDLTDASKYGTLPVPKKRGYIFKGWSLNETTENKSLFEKDTDIYFQMPDCWRYNDNMIYYDYLIIYCHLWNNEIDSSEKEPCIYPWKSEKEMCTYVGNNIYKYTIPAGSDVNGVVFASNQFDQTNDISLGTVCANDVLTIPTPDKPILLYRSIESSSYTSYSLGYWYEAEWAVNKEFKSMISKEAFTPYMDETEIYNNYWLDKQDRIIDKPQNVKINGYKFVDTNTDIPLAISHNLYAVWENADLYYLSYNMNGGNGAIEPQDVYSNEKAIITSYQPTRTDYAFLGWSKQPDSVTAQYKAGNEISLSSNTTLYAVWAKKLSSSFEVTVTPSSFTYDGTRKQPTITLKDGQKTVSSDYYDIIYKDNVNAGTATITITGKGIYTGSISKTFTISPKSISSMELTVNPTSFVYDGNEKKPAVTLKDGTTTISSDNYTVSYTSNKGAGTGKVTVQGKGNYTGSLTKEFTISPKSIANMDLTVTPTSFVYDGNEKKPTVTLKDGTTTISPDNYTVSYTSNKSAGTGKVTVQGKGNYKDSLTKEFTISPKSISSMELTVNPTSFVYDGQEKKPTVVLKDGTTTISSDNYTVSYTSNKDAGTGKVTVQGKGNYTGSLAKEFTISPKSIVNMDLTINPTSFVYDGQEKKPTVVLKDGTTTISSDNYTVSYTSNKDAGTGKVIVQGKGNYTGSLTKEFTISPKSIFNMDLTVNPTSFVYDGNEKKPTVTLKDGTTTISADNYTVSYTSNKNAGTGKVIVQGKGNYTGSLTKEFTISPKSIFNMDLTVNPTSFVYDGNEKKPTVTLKDGTTTISADNYTVSYTSNKSAGTGNVTVQGKGNYTGSLTKEFTINAKNIGDLNISLNVTSCVYNGQTRYPSVNAFDGNAKLVNGTDFDVSYKNNKNAGSASVSITGKGNYTGTVERTLTINPKSITDLDIKLNVTSCVYNGQARYPSVNAFDGNTKLVKGTDFDVSYKNNKNAGSAFVSITGKGNYTGTVERTLTINPKSITDLDIKLNVTSCVYNGQARYPGVIALDGETKLIKGTDFDVTYENNINVGKASVNITGKGNYTGSVERTLTIDSKPVSELNIDISPISYVFDGNPKKPSVTVKHGTKTLVSGTDYNVSYSGNVNVGTASVTIIGVGNYNGYAKKNFTIGRKSITDISISVSPLSYTFDGNAKTPSVTVKDGTKTLVRDTDYSLKYENNINPGTARVIISGINSYGGSVTKNFSINENPKKDISEMDIAINPFYYYYDGKAKTPAVTVKKGTTSLKKDTHYTVTYSNNTNVGQGIVKITGKGDYSGSCEKSFNIYPRYISEATVALENDSLEYNGKERKPKTIVTIGSQTLVRNTDYSVTYSDNINIGMATATITGKNNYQGSVKLSFSIVNPKTEFVWKRDNWNFNNSGEYFFYGTKTYGQLMNNKYRQKLMDSLSYVEYEDVFRGSSQAKAWIDELWQGSCYGMSATAFLSQSGFMQYSQYHQGASRLNDLLASDEDVLSVINYYQMLQIKDSCQQQFAHTPKNSQKQNIEQIISLLGTNSVVMVGIKQEKTNFAHELLAYGYEYGSWTKNGVTYTGRILICDPNYSSNKDSNNNDSYIYFKHDTYQWTIPIYKNYQVSSGYGAVFNHISANINEINEGGYMSAYIASNHNPNFVARLNAYAISDNRSVVKVKETSGGNYMNLAPAPGEIEEAYSYVMYGNDKKGTLGYNLYDSEAAYKVEQDAPVNMQLSLKYENCRLSAGSAAGKKALFDPKGFVEVYGDSAEYDLSMVFNEDYPTDWFAIEVSGENSNEASLLKGRTGYVVSGDNLKNVKVYVNNKQDSASISFSTDYKAVYIYEIDKNTIGLKVDKDSNGTYETSIKGVPILENNSYISSSKIKIGSSVNVTASAKGGSGNLQYAVLYKKKSDTKWTVKQNFSTNTTVSVKPANATDYDICVKVRDSDGNVEKKFFVLNVYDVLANKSSISDTYISLGSTVTVHASATGGTGSYTYAVLYKKKADTTWTIKQNFSKNANISIKPAKATDYNICIKVKDDNGDIEKKYFVVKVYDVLSNTSTVASTQINLGSSVLVKASAKGGTGDYTYAVLYKKKTDTAWTIKQNFSKTSAVYIKPAKAVVYDVCVKVKDSNGAVSKKFFEITVK